MDAKEYLKQYYFLMMKVDSLNEELRVLEELADGTQGCNFEPRIDKTRTFEAPFIKYIDRIITKREEISKKVYELLKLKEEIQATIAKIDDPLTELILTFRYVNCMDWNDIAKKTHYAKSYVFELHRKGLKEVQKLV